ncbi:ABC transporter ATP-binding protein/permease [Actinoplanes bogorensis]|uniref:ABC transporter ATP-binding protein/permease n=1 Tax=Paractinoplanes bogorensis TaxID=1610840 RepID=A0ABS5YK29_9ACTN|nr:ABC transporter ATP-binding protein [Actinoplanes bogorensis]MBU2663836.1 ABC transporter ATP-binding protein/permease [Actinoplanes bogorensis]
MPGTTKDGSARRLFATFRPQRAALIGALLLALVSTGTSLLGPYLLGLATDLIAAGMVGRTLDPALSKDQVLAQLRGQGDGTLANVFSTMDLVPGEGVDFAKLATVVLASLVVFLVGGLCLWLQGRVVALAVQRVLFDLRDQVDRKLARLPLSYYDRTPPGEVLSRVTSDVDNLQQTLQLTVGQTVNMLFAILSVLVVMLVLSPTLALLVLITVPMAGALWFLVGKKAGARFAAQWAGTGAITARVEEVYSAHNLVRSFRRERQVRAAFDKENAALAEAEREAQALTGLIEPSTRFITDFAYVLVALFGAARVASGSMSLGEVLAFTQYAGMFTRPMVVLAGVAGQLQSGLASAARIFELMDAEEQRPDPENPDRPNWVRGRIKFDRVNFRYVPDVPLIRDLSLIVEPGSLVAIVGSTGSGKTTLGNLLMRFYEVDSGHILLDGVDIAEMTRDELRSQIRLVPQDPWLFHGTVAENITYGSPDATRDEMVAAARAAGVDRFVQGLPDGYDTVLNDDTTTISAGEKQLITLARAFLSPAAVLILDEATSSIDTRTEAYVQQAMGRLRNGRTSFVIAHRLSTVRMADVILVLDRGDIVERGTHDELIAAGGVYAGLHGA